MRLTHRDCSTAALGIALIMLGLAVPPSVGVGAVRSGDDGPGRGLRAVPGATSPALAALRARWRAGATLP
jgi:hypothetical protein